MWNFNSRTGEISLNGKLIGKGYAGGNIPPKHNPSAVNNPLMSNIKCVGPLPVGVYTIGVAHTEPTLGPLAMYLQPDSKNQMFGRSGFFIHADSYAHPGEASEGCIILSQDLRILIANSLDKQLTVSD